MQQLISNYRTMFLFRGIAAVLFGIVALVWPKMTLSALVFVFGLFAVISGITAVVAALRNTDFPGWGWLLAEGILGFAVGAVALGAGTALAGLAFPPIRALYDYSWFVGFVVSFVAYYVLMRQHREAVLVEQEVA